jgi:hypothetical protein
MKSQFGKYQNLRFKASINKFMVLAFAFFCFTLLLTDFTSVQAQRPLTNQVSNRRVSFIQPPPRQGTPKGTVPAGSRGCPQLTQKPMTALVPVTQQADGTQLRWALTSEDHPTFWFYVPYESQLISNAKFSLRDRTNQTLYETTVTLTKTPGVIGISLPKTAPRLENNQWYRLYLFTNISCQPNTPLEKDFAEAWVKREALTPTLLSQLEKATTLEKAILYAQNGIWSEAIATVAELHRTNPQDTQWNSLLQSGGFQSFANEPILEPITD